MACPICLSNEAEVTSLRLNDGAKVSCLQCGAFEMTRAAATRAKAIHAAERWRVSAWIREMVPPVLQDRDIDDALSRVPPSLLHRAERMLRQLLRDYPPGHEFSVDQLGKWEPYHNDNSGVVIIGGSLVASSLVSIGWNRDIQEMRFMIEAVLCSDLKWLVRDDRASSFQISPRGLLHLEGRSDTSSPTAFCAMWFSDEVFPLWSNVIEPAIRQAGYDPLRIDNKEHNGKIDDEIMASIRASRFVVSDFTGNRGGVYYEAGFAHGLGLPVIFMCREGDELHFDVRQYNCIFWSPDQLDEARERLKNRILATLGQGPLRVE